MDNNKTISISRDSTSYWLDICEGNISISSMDLGGDLAAGLAEFRSVSGPGACVVSADLEAEALTLGIDDKTGRHDFEDCESSTVLDGAWTIYHSSQAGSPDSHEAEGWYYEPTNCGGGEVYSDCYQTREAAEAAAHDWAQQEGGELSAEGATELLYEAGKEAKREGADIEHSAKFFEAMLAYADPEYIEAAEVLGDDALECFRRGLGPDVTTAARVAGTSSAATVELIARCNAEPGVEVDQDWGAESTTFTFADGSKIVIAGPTFEVK